jgi:hypothetical protein
VGPSEGRLHRQAKMKGKKLDKGKQHDMGNMNNNASTSAGQNPTSDNNQQPMVQDQPQEEFHDHIAQRT